MIFKSLDDVVILPSKRDVLRVHIYTKLLKEGIKPFENDLDIILELYMFGGYNNPEEQNEFIEICLKKKMKKSKQSLRNTLSKYVTLGVFDKPKNTILHVNPKFIEQVKCDKLVLLHKVSHAE